MHCLHKCWPPSCLVILLPVTLGGGWSVAESCQHSQQGVTTCISAGCLVILLPVTCLFASLLAEPCQHSQQGVTTCAQVVDDFSSHSFRLLAGSVGILRDLHRLSLVQMTQQQIEASASEMQLLSLVVLTNSVRGDSGATIHQLQEG